MYPNFEFDPFLQFKIPTLFPSINISNYSPRTISNCSKSNSRQVNNQYQQLPSTNLHSFFSLLFRMPQFLIHWKFPMLSIVNTLQDNICKILALTLNFNFSHNKWLTRKLQSVAYNPNGFIYCSSKVTAPTWYTQHHRNKTVIGVFLADFYTSFFLSKNVFMSKP